MPNHRRRQVNVMSADTLQVLHTAFDRPSATRPSSKLSGLKALSVGDTSVFANGTAEAIFAMMKSANSPALSFLRQWWWPATDTPSDGAF
jgi:hypothetical protein